MSAEAGSHAKTADQQWDELPEVERLAAMLYNAKAQSPLEMTAERWLGIKARFRTSAQICMDEAQQMIEDGELDD